MGASCCAQQPQNETETEIENKYKYDPNKVPTKGALHSRKTAEDKKMVKFPTRVRQEADEKDIDDEEPPQQDDLGDMDVDVKSKKSKKFLFTKQKSQFVKASEDDL